MILDKLPSIISETEFEKDGFALTGSGLLAPAYIASQLGFSSIGMTQLNMLYQCLREEANVLPLCPFTACSEYLDIPILENLKVAKEVLNFWSNFNRIIGQVNYGELMPRSKLMIAILDGGHALDDGVSAEIGFYAGKYIGRKPIVGIRGDFRLAENPAAPINSAIRHFMDQGPYNGLFFTGPNAYDEAIKSTASLVERMRN